MNLVKSNCMNVNINARSPPSFAPGSTNQCKCTHPGMWTRMPLSRRDIFDTSPKTQEKARITAPLHVECPPYPPTLRECSSQSGTISSDTECRQTLHLDPTSSPHENVPTNVVHSRAPHISPSSPKTLGPYPDVLGAPPYPCPYPYPPPPPPPKASCPSSQASGSPPAAI